MQYVWLVHGFFHFTLATVQKCVTNHKADLIITEFLLYCINFRKLCNSSTMVEEGSCVIC